MVVQLTDSGKSSAHNGSMVNQRLIIFLSFFCLWTHNMLDLHIFLICVSTRFSAKALKLVYTESQRAPIALEHFPCQQSFLGWKPVSMWCLSCMLCKLDRRTVFLESDFQTTNVLLHDSYILLGWLLDRWGYLHGIVLFYLGFAHSHKRGLISLDLPTLDCIAYPFHCSMAQYAICINIKISFH